MLSLSKSVIVGPFDMASGGLLRVATEVGLKICTSARKAWRISTTAERQCDNKGTSLYEHARF